MSKQEEYSSNLRMAKLMNSTAGRQMLSTEFTKLFKEYRDYVGIGRRFLRVDPLGQGVSASYDTDPKFGAVCIDQDGETPLSMTNTSRFNVNTFEITCPVEFSLSGALEARFNLLDRIRDKGMVEIHRKEDKIIFAALDTASTDLGVFTPGSLVPAVNQVSPEALIAAKSTIKSNYLNPVHALWHPKASAWIESLSREWLDPETQADLVRAGSIGTYLGLKHYNSPEVVNSTDADGNEIGNGYIMAEAEYLGRMPMRKDITVLPMDSPKRLTLGYNIFEIIGVTVLNTNAVVKLGYKVTTYTT